VLQLHNIPPVIAMEITKILIAAIVLCWTWTPVIAEDEPDTCFVFCRPELKIEPTFTWENAIGGPRIAENHAQGSTTVKRLESESVFETVIALEVPTALPRVSLTLEVILKPFEKGSKPELETELNLHWLELEVTNGWIGSHFDIIDKYSPGARPGTLDDYTHKLNLELDTAVRFLKWTNKRWMSDVEIELSIDYVASGLPRAGDTFENITYLDDASPWSFSLVFVLPLAPLQ
jgi:hypothetical protein